MSQEAKKSYRPNEHQVQYMVKVRHGAEVERCMFKKPWYFGALMRGKGVRKVR